MNALLFREIPHDSPEYHETVALRYEVLRKPLGLEFTPVQLNEESSSYHLACYQNNKLVGCLVLVPVSASEIKMRQVAIAPHAQGQGIGRALVQFSETFAIERGHHLMTLHARETAVPFYEKLGYHTVGERFEEVTIPHWAMEKELHNSDVAHCSNKKNIKNMGD